MNKKLVCLISAFSLLCCFNSVVFAETDKTIEKTEEFIAEDSEYSYNFDEKIISDNKEYILKDVRYEVVGTEDITTDTEYERSLSWNSLETQDYNFPADYNFKDTKTGEVINCKYDRTEWENTNATDRHRTVTKQVTSEYSTQLPTFPTTTEVVFTDKATGEEIKASLQYVNTDVLEAPKWIDDIEFNLTVTDYESEVYYLNASTVMKYDDSKPNVNGIEDDILDYLQLDKNYYRITGAEWVGKEYTQNGKLVRNAIIKGSRYVGKWVANYKSDIPLPDVIGYNATTYYKGKKMQTIGTKNTVKAIATYELVNKIEEKEVEKPKQNETKKSNATLIALGVGGVSVAVAVGAFFYLVVFNNVLVYNVSGKKLFSTVLKKKNGKYTADVSKIYKYSDLQFKCKIKRSKLNQVNKGGIRFIAKGKDVSFIRSGDNFNLTK